MRGCLPPRRLAAVYRGQHLDGAAAARAAIAEAEAAGGRIAAFFSESILSCGGQVGRAAAAGHALRNFEAEQLHCHVGSLSCASTMVAWRGSPRSSAEEITAAAPVVRPLLQVLLPPGYLEGVYREVGPGLPCMPCVMNAVQLGHLV